MLKFNYDKQFLINMSFLLLELFLMNKCYVVFKNVEIRDKNVSDMVTKVRAKRIVNYSQIKFLLLFYH